MRAGVNESTGTEGSRKIFVGAFNMHVKAINPNKAELAAMGINVESEPDYFLAEDQTNKKPGGIMIRFMLENRFREDTVRASVTFFLRKEFVESRKDPEKPKFNYIDQEGRTIFLEESQVQAKKIPYDWIHVPTLKKAVRGEAELVNFLRNLFNSAKGEPTYLENKDIQKLFAGDLSEIKKLVKDANDKGNAVRVLLLPRITKEGRPVQYVFDKNFDRAWSSSSKYLHKTLMENLERLPQGTDVSMFSPLLNEQEFYMREIDPAKITRSAPAVPQAGAVSELTGASAASFFDSGDDDLPF